MTTQLPDDLQLDNDFWQFSLSIWQDKKIQEALLRLQDIQHLRVNLLLFSMWLGIERKSISHHFIMALKSTEAWHQRVVSPLREVRKALPLQSPLPMLKPHVQNSELLAEQIEQSLLYKCAFNIPTTTAEPAPDDASSSNNTLSILIRNLLTCARHAQTIQQLNTFGHEQQKKTSTLSASDLLLLVRACLPIHPTAHISACIESLTTQQ